MARPKQFDPESALTAAIGIFGEHGYSGTSAEMLVGAMGIGKQSLYDTFGGKWLLYCAAVEKYGSDETGKHLKVLQGTSTAWDGVQMMMQRVVREANQPCLGTGSVAEFGNEHEDLIRIREAAGRALVTALSASLKEAQIAGAVGADVNVNQAANFLIANIAAIRIAARGGASGAELSALARFALRALA